MRLVIGIVWWGSLKTFSANRCHFFQYVSLIKVYCIWSTPFCKVYCWWLCKPHYTPSCKGNVCLEQNLPTSDLSHITDLEISKPILANQGYQFRRDVRVPYALKHITWHIYCQSCSSHAQGAQSETISLMMYSTCRGKWRTMQKRN